MRAEDNPVRPQEIDLDDTLDRQIEAALAWHDDDPRATIDILYLRQQLALAEAAMSRGMTRGWVPSFERRIQQTSGLPRNGQEPENAQY
jgi:hypothetical protein